MSIFFHELIKNNSVFGCFGRYYMPKFTLSRHEQSPSLLRYLPSHTLCFMYRSTTRRVLYDNFAICGPNVTIQKVLWRGIYPLEHEWVPIGVFSIRNGSKIIVNFTQCLLDFVTAPSPIQPKYQSNKTYPFSFR